MGGAAIPVRSKFFFTDSGLRKAQKSGTDAYQPWGSTQPIVPSDRR